MIKEIQVLGSEIFENNDVILYCTSDAIQNLSTSEVLQWFGDAKEVKLGSIAEVFSIQSIAPMNSFIDKMAVMLKINVLSTLDMSYPTTAIIQ